MTELYEETKELKKRNTGELATAVKLEYYAEIENSETLKLSFKIGQTRMYVLNKIRKFALEIFDDNEETSIISNRFDFASFRCMLFKRSC